MKTQWMAVAAAGLFLAGLSLPAVARMSGGGSHAGMTSAAMTGHGSRMSARAMSTGSGGMGPSAMGQGTRMDHMSNMPEGMGYHQMAPSDTSDGGPGSQQSDMAPATTP